MTVKKSILLLPLLILSIEGCATIPPEPTSTVTPTVTITFTLTATITLTPTLTPTNTITPSPTSTYCDYDAAMIVVAYLDNLTKSSSEEENNTNLEDFEITEEQRDLLIKILNQYIDEMESMDVPECLQTTVGHLQTSYEQMIELFTESPDRTMEDAFGLLFAISEEQRLFNEEFARIKECIPTGCQ